MPLAPQVLAECEMIDARFRRIQGEVASPWKDGSYGLPWNMTIRGSKAIIAQLETDKARLENILGDTDKKEQDHLL